MVHGYLGIVQPNSFPKGKNYNDAGTISISSVIILVQNAIGFFIKLGQLFVCFFSLCGCLRLNVVKNTHLRILRKVLTI